MLPMARLDPVKSFLSNLAPYLILVYSIIVNYNIWYHFLITHYHIYTMFVDIDAGRIKSEALMSHKRDSMVRSAVETMTFQWWSRHGWHP